MSEMRVHKTITVQAPIEHAFRVFTAGFDKWWPRAHHIGKAELEEAVLEQRLGGRWFERCVDGTECDWGKVLAWEPPRRVVVSWHLDGAFQYDPDPAHASEVEVRFTAEGGGVTRVELEHKHIERHGATAEAVVKGVDSGGGWASLLADFARHAASSIEAQPSA
ncbi:MAG TPA: SRPBCC family protein [Byssovorax sp.]|jgi:uncharacterized protein YndB with AHSA1/START domain